MHSLLLISPVDTTRHTQVQVLHESTSPVDTLKDQRPLKSITWNPNMVHCAMHSLLSLSLSHFAAPHALPYALVCCLPGFLRKPGRCSPYLTASPCSTSASRTGVPTPPAEPSAAQAVELSRPRRPSWPQRLHCRPKLLNSSAPSAPFLEKREQGEEGIYIQAKELYGVLFAKYLTQVNSAIVL
jgi:hypothetical protein